MTRLLAIILFLLPLLQIHAQPGNEKSSIPDSVLEKRHSPTRATLYSTFLPGLGQVYNKKYWKVPIVYAGFGVFAYFINQNTNKYMEYHCAYIEDINNAKHGNYQSLVDKYSADNLLSAANYYRRNLDVSVILCLVWYIMNILDATVDAHLYTYNISKDIALRAGPTLVNDTRAGRVNPGLSLSLTFK